MFLLRVAVLDRFYCICFTGTVGQAEVKLVGGLVPYQGLLEVKLYNHWGTVCDDKFGDEEASIVCKMLGYNR